MGLLKDNRIRFMLVMFLTAGAVWVLLAFPLRLGLDLQGGMRMVLEADPAAGEKFDTESLQGTLQVISQRVDGLGVSEPLIQRKGDKQIIVELPGIKDSDRAIKMIGKTALLEFIESERVPEGIGELTPEQVEILGGKGARLDHVPIYNRDGDEVGSRPVLLKQTAMTGRYLNKVWPGTDQFGRPICNISFNDEGTKLFYEVTQRNVGKPLAIVLDGKVINAPTVQTAISGGQAYIEGLTLVEMKDLVNLLKAGALPVPVKLVENKIVGPTLGRDAIEKSKRAGWVGVSIVIAYMAVFYRLPGVLAAFALGFYALYTAALFKVVGSTLTLPGIAGFLLSLGMAVDANVIIFERMREELRAGNSFKITVELGFARAFTAIFDSNVTTWITAIVLFWLGTGSIRGFAVTLSLGVAVSMFTAIILTRIFCDAVVAINLSARSVLLRR